MENPEYYGDLFYSKPKNKCVVYCRELQDWFTFDANQLSADQRSRIVEGSYCRFQNVNGKTKIIRLFISPY